MKKKLVKIRGRYDILMERIIEEHRDTRRRRRKIENGDDGDADKDLLDILLDISEDASLEIRLSIENIKAFILGIKRKLVGVRGRYDIMMDRIIQEHRDIRKLRKVHGDGAWSEKDLLDILLDISEDESMEITLSIENIKAFILGLVNLYSFIKFRLDSGVSVLV
ncbi:hypothetical protein AG4045_026962 [Apium graveolens]|uniref:Uncharacterized protein n=1 Tax=Apium graveolens TaxID=4045 RepID=A0A6L5B7U4_APIGR|nr:hypothetical protein AG4045_026962 [Apium graveolens]